MKKRFCTLISLLLIAALLAACTADVAGGESSLTDVSDAESAVSKSDETSQPDASGDESQSEQSDEVSAESEPDTYYTAVSIGKSYTLSVATNPTYPDSHGIELTDGILAPSTAGYSFAGAAGFNDNVSVVVDLGDDGKKINRFEVEYVVQKSSGIHPMQSCTVYGSNDGTEYKSLGSLSVPAYAEGPQTATLDIAKVDYRYIKFTCNRGGSFLFLSEVTVFADVEPAKSKVFETAKELYAANGLSDGDTAAGIAAVASGKAVNKSLTETLISKGKAYSFLDGDFDTRAGSNDYYLTDGSYGNSIYDAAWVGASAAKKNALTLMLGNISDAYRFVLHAYSNEAMHICLPAYVDVFVGSKTTELTRIGRVYAGEVQTGSYTYEIVLSTCVKANYVRFVFAQGEKDAYYWFEEACVYAYRTASTGTRTTVYDPVVLPTVTNDEYYDSTVSDYNTTQNLLKGLPQQIMAANELSYESYGGYHQNTEPECKWLTDGKYAAGTDCYAFDWFHFKSGGKRTIFYDFTKVVAVKSYSLSFLNHDNWGIFAPDTITVMLSTDGVTWYKAGESSRKLTGDKAAYAILYDKEFDKAYQARFVAISFGISEHVFADEFVINGTKNASAAIKLTDSGFATTTIGGTSSDAAYQAPSESLLGGVHDVMLIYHNFSSANYNKDFFMPYVAYLDEDKNVKDTFIDGYLFLPDVGVMVKGKPTSTNYKVDWDSLFNSLFKSGQNFDGLEQAAAETATALGLTDFKVKAFATIPYISATLKDFGDVDGDGKSEDFTNLADRIKVVKWYVERVTAEFNSRGYQHIELCGWYWFQESAGGTEDYVTIPAVSEYIHSIGSQLFWIPYFCAGGYSDWQELGFDVCCMQPNYAFNADADYSRITSAASIIKQYNMCIEMEMSWDILDSNTSYDKWMDYLAGGIEYGYMNDSIHMYYQSLQALASASRSTDSRVRLIYDYTYLFVKGKLTPAAKPTDKTVEVKADTVFVGDLGTADGIGSYKITLSTEHGSILVTADGKYYYYPEKGFKGTDSFTFAVNNLVGWSESATVTFNVK